eukprot:6317878-Lingulodinium_polyedra.AAC.1
MTSPRLTRRPQNCWRTLPRGPRCRKRQQRPRDRGGRPQRLCCAARATPPTARASARARPTMARAWTRT